MEADVGVECEWRSKIGDYEFGIDLFGVSRRDGAYK
jgi:hypothetical protein